MSCWRFSSLAACGAASWTCRGRGVGVREPHSQGAAASANERRISSAGRGTYPACTRAARAVRPRARCEGEGSGGGGSGCKAPGRPCASPPPCVGAAGASLATRQSRRRGSAGPSARTGSPRCRTRLRARDAAGSVARRVAGRSEGGRVRTAKALGAELLARVLILRGRALRPLVHHAVVARVRHVTKGLRTGRVVVRGARRKRRGAGRGGRRGAGGGGRGADTVTPEPPVISTSPSSSIVAGLLEATTVERGRSAASLCFPRATVFLRPPTPRWCLWCPFRAWLFLST
jgi:hypothetical protein